MGASGLHHRVHLHNLICYRLRQLLQQSLAAITLPAATPPHPNPQRGRSDITALVKCGGDNTIRPDCVAPPLAGTRKKRKEKKRRKCGQPLPNAPPPPPPSHDNVRTSHNSRNMAPDYSCLQGWASERAAAAQLIIDYFIWAIPNPRV